MTRPTISCRCGAPLNHDHRCRIDRENCRPTPVYDALFWPVALGALVATFGPWVVVGAAVGVPWRVWNIVNERRTR